MSFGTNYAECSMPNIAPLKTFYYRGIMELETASRRIAALAHERRLSVFRLLVRAGPRRNPRANCPRHGPDRPR